MATRTYGVRELQANLGEALRAVGAGDEILITSRGRPVAILAQADGRVPRESAVDRKLRRLAVAGKLRLGKPGRIPRFKPFPGTGVSAQVLADRR